MEDLMNHANGEQPGLPGFLKAKWKAASGARKVMWLVLALLAAYLTYRFKTSRDEVLADAKRRSTK